MRSAAGTPGTTPASPSTATSSTDPSRTAFFPLFPTLTRMVAELQGRTDRPGLFVAAIIVANVCLVIATMVLAAVVRLDLSPDDARRSLWYLLAFPTSLFLSAGYSESLFLAPDAGCHPGLSDATAGCGRRCSGACSRP